MQYHIITLVEFYTEQNFNRLLESAIKSSNNVGLFSVSTSFELHRGKGPYGSSNQNVFLWMKKEEMSMLHNLYDHYMVVGMYGKELGVECMVESIVAYGLGWVATVSRVGAPGTR